MPGPRSFLPCKRIDEDGRQLSGQQNGGRLPARERQHSGGNLAAAPVVTAG